MLPDIKLYTIADIVCVCVRSYTNTTLPIYVGTHRTLTFMHVAIKSLKANKNSLDREKNRGKNEVSFFNSQWENDLLNMVHRYTHTILFVACFNAIYLTPKPPHTVLQMKLIEKLLLHCISLVILSYIYILNSTIFLSVYNIAIVPTVFHINHNRYIFFPHFVCLFCLFTQEYRSISCPVCCQTYR